MRTKKILFFFFVIILGLGTDLAAREYHVSVRGDDHASGDAVHPFRTISKAASVAVAGDVIMVHGGTYREWVRPVRGGVSEDKRIVYRAAPGEQAVIKGSEVIRGWERFRGNVWRVTLPDTFFGDFNPYKEVLHGDWFNGRGRVHHNGKVFLNGQALYESDILEHLFRPVLLDTRDGRHLYPWYCESDDRNTYIYANFGDHDPNRDTVEITVRKACFYPGQPGVDFITVQGFVMRQAATPWAPPTAEQVGLLGTFWSKGWIIEDNVISDARCVGITLGKDRKTGQNVWSENPDIDGATHYNEVIFRALREGWSKENIGSHIVRNNEIFHCEQAGIVGSLGAVFSEIYNNHVHDTWVERLFTGAEIAGIKLHGAIDVVIRHNRIHNTGRGIWLDWMAQGTRVTGNLLYDHTEEDLFTEVNHGPFLVDNNLFLSGKSLRNWSEGAAFVHNLLTGYVEAYEERKRFTPYMFPHSTQVAGLRNTWNGQERFYNNIMAGPGNSDHAKRRGNSRDMQKGWGLCVYDPLDYQILAAGNVYLNGTRPYRLEPDHLLLPGFDPDIHLEEEGGHVYLFLTLPDEIGELDTPFVTTAFLGTTKNTRLFFEDPDGGSLEIDTDYFGDVRNKEHPLAGPFEGTATSDLKIKVW